MGSAGGGANEPRFTAALDSPSPLARREALIALCDSRYAAPSAQIAALANDNDATVHQAAIVALAARHAPEAMESINRALRDPDPDTSRTAVAAFGLLPDGVGAAPLAVLARGDNELLRIEAVAALADLGEGASVLAAAADKAWQVRQVVAAALAVGPKDTTTARRLIADRSLEVACQTVDSLRDWPTDRAVPLLLESLAGATYLPRKLAAEQLATRWPPMGRFDLDASQPQRIIAVEHLQTAWRQSAATAQ